MREIGASQLAECLQPLGKCAKRSAPMTDSGFLLGREFGGSRAALRNEEMGVVSKPVGAARPIDDPSFDGTLCFHEHATGFGERDGASKASRAPCLGHISQFPNEPGVVVGVALLFAGKTRRLDAGCYICSGYQHLIKR